MREVTEITNKGIKMDIVNMLYGSKMYEMRNERYEKDKPNGISRNEKHTGQD